eukprot:jgi/Mesvir1/11113/Mv08111-RA.1
MAPEDAATHAEFMREAIALSMSNAETAAGGPFGAVVVKDGKIVGRGMNRVTATNDPTAHAEVCAIRDACASLGTFSLQGCTLYTSCKPCPMCLSSSYWAQLSRIYYGNSDKDAADIGFQDKFLYDMFRGEDIGELRIPWSRYCARRP